MDVDYRTMFHLSIIPLFHLREMAINKLPVITAVGEAFTGRHEKANGGAAEQSGQRVAQRNGERRGSPKPETIRCSEVSGFRFRVSVAEGREAGKEI